MNNLQELQNTIGYQFRNKKLLQLALTHSSYANEHNLKSNETLEFLGDGILEAISSDYLYDMFPKANEGQLTKLRAENVSEKALSDKARDIALGKYILLGNGERKTNGRERDSLLADTMEALIGAIYKDSDYINAQEFVLHHILNDLNTDLTDYKSQLQEKLQEQGKSLEYVVIDEHGADNDKTYVVGIVIDGEQVATGYGKNKKTAEQESAKKVLMTL